MSISFYDQSPYLYYVYALICQDDEGPLYIKFGRTRNLQQRLTALRVTSPIPARYFAYVEARGKYSQGNIEKALHSRFAPRRTSGEWFKFDAKSVEDKRDFNDGSIEVFASFLGQNATWNKISTKALDELIRRKQLAYYHTTEKRVRGGVAAVKARQGAWKELASYGR